MYLILSIIFSSSLFIIFKYFNIYKVNTLQAIVANYIVAFSIGMFSANSFGRVASIKEQPWFFGALILGGLFMSVFFVMARTAQKNGVSVASVSGKMSVIVPVLFGVILYNESVTYLKVLGVLIALSAVYLSSIKDKQKSNLKAGIMYPFLLFLGSGIIDTTLKYVEINYVSPNQVAFFSGSLFGVAGIVGVSLLIIKHFTRKEKIEIKSIIAGIVLGIPNYFSIVFLIKALQNKQMESSTLFTINNVGVVVVSTFMGLFLFKEQFSTKNKVGILLALLGIILIAIA